ncbi:hypothetical protein WR164_01500 [Philodulcilactobacillus myokoensis]|uniref:Plasmid replication protein RepL domain-containing protein n=1 Tax=Philodulcilactobacillus myokoensis TaxID=2929573 RepID=A0A9W6B056_9LACO|nr:replication/maintenance protein RepL [Philodulcilactobacillus myokoensis]GLB46171.1 hypothetical protein WR164_01500 [Philodulcilactobacillus myokoensis]
MANQNESIYHSWLRINKAKMGNIIDLMKHDANACEILFYLIDIMDKSNQREITSAELTQITGKSRQTIYRGTKTLKQKHFIAVVNHGGANRYIVNDSIVWQTNNHKYYSSSAFEIFRKDRKLEHIQRPYTKLHQIRHGR